MRRPLYILAASSQTPYRFFQWTANIVLLQVHTHPFRKGLYLRTFLYITPGRIRKDTLALPTKRTNCTLGHLEIEEDLPFDARTFGAFDQLI